MPAFADLFSSPHGLADLATKHAGLQNFQSLCEEVCKLVGGPACVAAGSMSKKDLVQFLYHSAVKFSRGKATQEILPQSEALVLRKNKTLVQKMTVN